MVAPGPQARGVLTDLLTDFRHRRAGQSHRLDRRREATSVLRYDGTAEFLREGDHVTAFAKGQGLAWRTVDLLHTAKIDDVIAARPCRNLDTFQMGCTSLDDWDATDTLGGGDSGELVFGRFCELVGHVRLEIGRASCRE